MVSLRTAAAVVMGALATAAVASLLQTQINLYEISRLAVQVPVSVRVGVTIEDLARFGPVMFGFALAAAVLALPLRALLRLGRFGHGGFGGLLRNLIASVVMLAVVLWLLRSVIPMPAIAAIRTLPGLGIVTCAGLVGGLIGHLFACRGAAVDGTVSADRGDRAVPDAAPARRTMIAMIAVGLLLPATSFLIMRPTASPLPPRAAGYQVETVLTGLDRPWSLAHLPDGGMLVTEMAGRLRYIDATGASTDVSVAELPPPYHRGRTIGLMDVALSPTFAYDRRVYLTMGYQPDGGSGATSGVRLVRGRLQDMALRDVEILFESTPKASDGNNGGRMVFLDDSTLLLTVGDGSVRREEAQNPDNSLGKVMRIRVRPDASSTVAGPGSCAVVATDAATEMVRNAPSALPLQGAESKVAHGVGCDDGPIAVASVYTMGHRNPQGIARDARSGDVHVTEHGPRGGDELNRLRPGGNYGWPLATHGIDYPFARVSPFTHLEGLIGPELDWTPSIAPSGLTIYEGSLFPQWRGDFLVPSLKERSIRRLIRREGLVVEQQLLLAERGERIRDVRVGRDGALYVLTDGVDGSLLRVTPTRTGDDT